jgi:hypothetical protein
MSQKCIKLHMHPACTYLHHVDVLNGRVLHVVDALPHCRDVVLTEIVKNKILINFCAPLRKTFIVFDFLFQQISKSAFPLFILICIQSPTHTSSEIKMY